MRLDKRIKLVAAGLAALAVLGVALAVGLWPQQTPLWHKFHLVARWTRDYSR